MKYKPLFSDSDFLLSIFNAIPTPVFVVDDDIRMLYMNRSATEIAAGEKDLPYLKRGGDVLHCIHTSESPAGCGHAPSCADCVIRSSVWEALHGGKVYRKKTRMSLRSNDTSRDVHLLVTTSPFLHEGRQYSLLILEDISELLQLRSLLPVCAWCKKIRDDDNYWQSLEDYFGTHLHLDVSHGMCDECYRKMQKELENL
jgi:PAS domain-containing protein